MSTPKLRESQDPLVTRNGSNLDETTRKLPSIHLITPVNHRHAPKRELNSFLHINN